MKRTCTLVIGLMVALSLVFLAATAHAGIPEPDVIFYGYAKKDGKLLGSGEVALLIDGDQESPARYAYALGSVSDYGDRYMVKASMDALDPGEGRMASFFIDGELAGIQEIPAKGSLIELDLELPNYKDSDGDGMPDSWEMKYHKGGDGLDPLKDDANGNLDGDRATNLQEHLEGTDPTDPSSVSDKSRPEEENRGPAAPARNYPVSNSETDSINPVLSISNANDPDAHFLGYDFEVYADAALSSLAAAAYNVQEGSNTTSWRIDAQLQNDTSY